MSRPSPGSEAQSIRSTRSFYDRISHVYDLLADSSEHESREEGVAALAIEPGSRVLEIGFGTGHSLVDLAGRVGDAGRVFGIDISAGMLDVARRRVAASGLVSKVELFLADGSRLPFADRSLDAVFASFTLELFPSTEMRVVLAEVRRVLAPRGQLGVVAMAEADHPSLGVDLYKWLHRHFPHIVDCQPIDASGLLEEAGFIIRARRDRAIWSLPVAVLVAQPG